MHVAIVSFRADAWLLDWRLPVAGRLVWDNEEARRGGPLAYRND